MKLCVAIVLVSGLVAGLDVALGAKRLQQAWNPYEVGLLPAPSIAGYLYYKHHAFTASRGVVFRFTNGTCRSA